METAISVTTLYCIRNIIQRAIYEGQDIRDASHVLIPLLREALLKALGALDADQCRIYRPALFWMYFCGAHYEERVDVGFAQPCDQPTNGWFRHMLVVTATQLNLMQWPEAERVLKMFIYTDLLPLDAADWYTRLLEPVLRSQHKDDDEYGQQASAWQEGSDPPFWLSGSHMAAYAANGWVTDIMDPPLSEILNLDDLEEGILDEPNVAELAFTGH
jgi:hypothetical protein